MSEHNHEHHHSVETLPGKKIAFVSLLNLTITTAEVIGGIVSGSLSLLSDALHNLSDTISILITYFANKIAGKSKNIHKTYGYKRAEILAAFINASALLVIAFFLIYEAIQRFFNPIEIKGTLMLIVASIGLAANLLSVFLLQEHSHENMNIRSGYLHLLGDTISSVGVILGALLIKFWNIVWVDPLITVLVALYLIRESWIIVINSANILMQSSADLDYTLLEKEISNLSGVINLHHLHTWMGNEKEIYLEAHVEVEDQLISESANLIEKIHHLLHENFEIHHSTLQLENGRCEDQALFKK